MIWGSLAACRTVCGGTPISVFLWPGDLNSPGLSACAILVFLPLRGVEDKALLVRSTLLVRLGPSQFDSLMPPRALEWPGTLTRLSPTPWVHGYRCFSGGMGGHVDTDGLPHYADGMGLLQPDGGTHKRLQAGGRAPGSPGLFASLQDQHLVTGTTQGGQSSRYGCHPCTM